MNRRDHELAAQDLWLRRLARQLARSITRADDLVQDTYITALRNAPSDAQLRPWLRVVMRKLAWGQLRSERRRAQREQGFSLTAPSAAMPDELLEQSIDRERLTAAVAGLPEPFHSTIVQRFFHGRSCADIARRENVPAATVRWRQARGLEMLRAELAIVRRQSILWALPFVGAGGQLVARAWQTLSGRGAGTLLWLWLACVAAIYAFTGSDAFRIDPPARSGIASAGVRSAAAAAAVSTARASAAILANDRERAAAAGSAAPPAPFIGLPPAEVIGGEPMSVLRAPSSPDRTLDAHDEDCRWDPVHGLRCTHAPSSAAPPARDALCALVHQQIVSSEAMALVSLTARGVLAAAMQANRALARRIGCPLPPAAIDLPAGGGSRAGCVTEVNADGAPCTVCPGERPVCAPAKCHSRTREDGVVCTTCVDAHGEARTDCPQDPSASCQSEVSASGLLCTSCDGGAPECLPAECVVSDRCLRCVDPRGRVGTDCSIDYEVIRSGSYGMSAKNVFFSSCIFSWGAPNTAGTTCHYPGLQTCTVSQTDTWHCLECQYPDGSGMSACMDRSEPLPDPLVDRPLDLPPPGSCTQELTADGMVACATCTRDDLSATTSCHHTDLESCDPLSGRGDPTCVATCRRADGTRVNVCNSARGPQPSEAGVTP